ncbi:MAG: hypothetical protein QM800_00985 [Paludibacter sp.]
MTTSVEKILEKILLPMNHDWVIESVSVNESAQEIYVELKYVLDFVSLNTTHYPIYDFRPMRTWRHLDLWEYKTFIRARLPRYKHDTGISSIEVPWADAVERMTYLLEKKR